MFNLTQEQPGVWNTKMASKIRPALTQEEKKRVAYSRKKGVLIFTIVLLVGVILVELGFLVAYLIGLAGS